MSRHKLRATNRARKAAAEARDAEILARPNLTPAQIADETKIPLSTVYRRLAKLREQLREANEHDSLEWRKVQLEELQSLREVLSDSKLSAGRRIELTLSILDREVKLVGSAAQSKAVVAHFSGPKLDALYLDIRAILMDLPREDQDQGLEHLRAWAKNRKKPVTVAAMVLEGTKCLPS